MNCSDSHHQFDKAFRDLYANLGLFNTDGSNMELHEVCSNRQVCWRNAENRFPQIANDPSRGEISKPFIGSRYPDVRLLFVGINMNDCGGYLAVEQLVEAAKAEIALGRKRVRFGLAYSAYRGTLLFHRIACYSALVLGKLGFLHQYQANADSISPQNLARAFDYLAFTNHIKCSPRDERNTGDSAPTDGMWQYCGRHILSLEIRLLKPRVIVVLGAGNLWHFQSSVINCPSAQWVQFGNGRNQIKTSIVEINGNPVVVLGLPHPHARGTKFTQTLDNFGSAIAESLLRPL